MNTDELRKAVLHQQKLSSQPIDWEQLERDGLIKSIRKGGVTYDVPNIAALPEHVRDRITEMKTGAGGLVRVKFKKQVRK